MPVVLVDVDSDEATIGHVGHNVIVLSSGLTVHQQEGISEASLEELLFCLLEDTQRSQRAHFAIIIANDISLPVLAFWEVGSSMNDRLLTESVWLLVESI